MSGHIVVRENGLGRYQQEVVAGEHRLLADEPTSLGGGDAGPAPFDLVMAGLGACTAITLRMYAERKGLALRHVSVQLERDKVGDDDATRDRIVRTITLEGDLTAEQRARLLEIAGKCPTARVLAQPLVLACRLAD
jgi:putative redox protein